MNDLSKISASHLCRAAYIYLRQSTPAQVEHNRESTQRQYALASKATTLGWPSQQVVVIDEDLGVSGSGVVAAVLRELRELSGSSPNIFPSPGKGGCMSSNTMLYALYRMGYHGRATTHGFRAVASTILNESNLFNRDWIERQLAHVERNEVRRAYNSAEWMPDRRRMMQWWADHITALALEGDKIIPLLRAG